MDIATDPPVALGEGDAVREIGARLAAFRAERGWTINALAELSGVSNGMISLLERGRSNPSVLTVMKLAGALEVPFADFFTGEESDSRTHVVRHDARRHLTLAGSEVEYELLSPSLSGRFAIYHTRTPAGWSGAAHPLQHEGEQFNLILEGVNIMVIGDQEFRLEAGDSITFDSTQPHWIHNPGPGTTVSMICVSPPNF